ncbi:MAG TPA: hypothetical protein VG734_11050 [Lacunisphaera sp.]|nr:hypothetical protein [Lacunisphaera sp.]
MPRPLFLALAIILPASFAIAAEPALEARLPLKPEIRKIFDRSCIMCHGEVIDGQKEIRDDLDLTTDETIRETLPEIGRLKQYILEDTMPNKPKLGRRLRNNQELQDRLTKLKADYAKSDDKAVLLEWLKDVVATTGEKKKDH